MLPLLPRDVAPVNAANTARMHASRMFAMIKGFLRLKRCTMDKNRKLAMAPEQVQAAVRSIPIWPEYPRALKKNVS